MKFGEPPAAIPNTPVMKSVILKDHLQTEIRISLHDHTELALRYEPSTDNIASKSPEGGTNQKTDIQCERQIWSTESEFVDSRRENEASQKLIATSMKANIGLESDLQARYYL